MLLIFMAVQTKVLNPVFLEVIAKSMKFAELDVTFLEIWGYFRRTQDWIIYYTRLLWLRKPTDFINLLQCTDAQ